MSLTNLASSVARNMERLSLDQDHMERSEAGRRYQPHGIVSGLMQGLSAFGISLLGKLLIKRRCSIADIGKTSLPGIMF